MRNPVQLLERRSTCCSSEPFWIHLDLILLHLNLQQQSSLCLNMLLRTTLMKPIQSFIHHAQSAADLRSNILYSEAFERVFSVLKLVMNM